MPPEHTASSHPKLPLAYNIFADFSSRSLTATELEAALDALVYGCGYDAAAGAVGFAVAPGTLAGAPSPVAAFRRALRAAARERRHLLVVLGYALPPNEIVPPLAAAFLSDPLIGTAQPRFADPRSGMILPFNCPVAQGAARVHPDVLYRLPSVTITAESVAAVLLLRREIVEGATVLESASSVHGALLGILVAARRRGFRNGVVASTVVALDADAAYPDVEEVELQTLNSLYPDMALAAAENDRLPLRRLEPLLDALHPPVGWPRRLLVDCRSVGQLHNGTSRVNLGMLDGLAAVAGEWEIDVAVQPDTMTFHSLSTRFPSLRMVSSPDGAYAAAYCPNQIWSLPAMAELHRTAAVFICSMLDTIAWDVVYAGNADLGDTWRTVGNHADGLTFISAFTRDRFVRRFAPPASTRLRVVHLSLDAGENTHAEFRGRPTGEHVLLVGNAYDHKALRPTVELLLRAFPLTRFVVLGLEGETTRRVVYAPSGKVTSEEVHGLVATARAIVYPSYYEGFGLPPVEGMAYGRSVLVRRSSLWDEIAAHTRLPGRLIPFEDMADLVESLGALLEGGAVKSLPAGGCVNGKITDWASHAAETLAVINDCVAAFDLERWRARDELFQLLRERV